MIVTVKLKMTLWNFFLTILRVMCLLSPHYNDCVPRDDQSGFVLLYHFDQITERLNLLMTVNLCETMAAV